MEGFFLNWDVILVFIFKRNGPYLYSFKVEY